MSHKKKKTTQNPKMPDVMKNKGNSDRNAASITNKMVIGMTNLAELGPESGWNKLLDEVFTKNDVDFLLDQIKEHVTKAYGVKDQWPYGRDKWYGSNPICLVAAAGHMNSLEQLLAYAKEHNMDIDHTMDCESNTPVHYAAIKGHTQVLEKLIAAGASLTATNKDGNTAFMCAMEHSIKAAEYLWDFKDKIDFQSQNKNNETVLHILARKNQVALLIRFLEDKEIRETMNWTDKDGNSAFMVAILNSSNAIIDGLWRNIKFLHQYGIGILEHVNFKKQRPIHLVCEKKLDFLSKMLSQVLKGMTDDYHTEIQQLGLHAADKDGNSPIFCCAINGYVEGVKLLVKAGAVVFRKNNQHITPICEAYKALNRDVGDYLISVLTDEELNIYVKDSVKLIKEDHVRDFPGGDETLFNIILSMFLTGRCRELLFKADIFLEWLHKIQPVIEGHGTTHILCILTYPYWGVKFKRQLALQYSKRCLDYTLEMMDDMKEKGFFSFAVYAMAPLLFLGQYKDIGSEWLSRNYHHLLPYIEPFEEELDEIVDVLEMEDDYKSKLWEDFKKRICDVQAVWSKRHAQELIASEDEAKSKKQRKRIKKKVKEETDMHSSDGSMSPRLSQSRDNNQTTSSSIVKKLDTSKNKLTSSWTEDGPDDGEWKEAGKKVQKIAVFNKTSCPVLFSKPVEKPKSRVSTAVWLSKVQTSDPPLNQPYIPGLALPQKVSKRSQKTTPERKTQSVTTIHNAQSTPSNNVWTARAETNANKSGLKFIHEWGTSEQNIMPEGPVEDTDPELDEHFPKPSPEKTSKKRQRALAYLAEQGTGDSTKSLKCIANSLNISVASSTENKKQCDPLEVYISDEERSFEESLQSSLNASHAEDDPMAQQAQTKDNIPKLNASEKLCNPSPTYNSPQFANERTGRRGISESSGQSQSHNIFNFADRSASELNNRNMSHVLKNHSSLLKQIDASSMKVENDAYDDKRNKTLHHHVDTDTSYEHKEPSVVNSISNANDSEIDEDLFKAFDIDAILGGTTAEIGTIDSNPASSYHDFESFKSAFQGANKQSEQPKGLPCYNMWANEIRTSSPVDEIAAILECVNITEPTVEISHKDHVCAMNGNIKSNYIPVLDNSTKLISPVNKQTDLELNKELLQSSITDKESNPQSNAITENVWECRHVSSDHIEADFDEQFSKPFLDSGKLKEKCQGFKKGKQKSKSNKVKVFNIDNATCPTSSIDLAEEDYTCLDSSHNIERAAPPEPSINLSNTPDSLIVNAGTPEGHGTSISSLDPDNISWLTISSSSDSCVSLDQEVADITSASRLADVWRSGPEMASVTVDKPAGVITVDHPSDKKLSLSIQFDEYGNVIEEVVFHHLENTAKQDELDCSTDSHDFELESRILALHCREEFSPEEYHEKTNVNLDFQHLVNAPDASSKQDSTLGLQTPITSCNLFKIKQAANALFSPDMVVEAKEREQQEKLEETAELCIDHNNNDKYMFTQVSPENDIWCDKQLEKSCPSLRYINRKWLGRGNFSSGKTHSGDLYHRIETDLIGAGDCSETIVKYLMTPENKAQLLMDTSPPCKLKTEEVKNLLPSFLLPDSPESNNNKQQLTHEETMKHVTVSVAAALKGLCNSEPEKKQNLDTSFMGCENEALPIPTIISGRNEPTVNSLYAQNGGGSGDDAHIYVNKLSQAWYWKMADFEVLPKEKLVYVAPVHFSTDTDFNIGKSSFDDDFILGVDDNGLEVAIKRTSINIAMLFKEMVNDMPEVLKWHNRIMPYTSICWDELSGYISYPLADSNLRQHLTRLKSEDRLTLPIQKTLVQQMLEGLMFLHRNGVVHGRLHPSNVLIDVDGNVRLADYGTTAEHKYRLLPREDVKRYWRSSEVAVTGDTNGGQMSDVQSGGMLFYYIMTGGEHPIGKSPADASVNIAKGWPKPKEISPDVDDIIQSMLAFVPRARPTVKNVLDSMFFWGEPKRYRYLLEVFIRLLADNERNPPAALYDRLNSIVLPELKEQDKSWRDVMDKAVLQDVEESFNQSNLKFSDSIISLLQFMTSIHKYFHQLQPSSWDALRNPSEFFLSRYKSLPNLVYHKLYTKEHARFADFLT